jgi:hypothetical protein
MPTTEQTEDGRRVVESPTEARQGAKDNRIRWVLTFGLIGVVIAFAIAYGVSV